MVATSGDRLLAPDAVDVLERDADPAALVVTPNLPEAAALLDAPIADDEADDARAGRAAARARRQGRADQRRSRRRAPRASICWSSRTRVTRLVGRAHRHPQHPRHRLHAVVRDRGGPRQGHDARRRGARRQELRHRARSPPPTALRSARATVRCIIFIAGGERSRTTRTRRRTMPNITRRKLVRAGAAGAAGALAAPVARARASQALAHGDVVAEAAARSRHVGRARRRAHPHALRRPARHLGARRGRGRAGLRGARRGRRRRRRDRPHRVVLLAGQDAGRGLLHHRAVRADARRARRLGRCRRRPGAVGRALRAVRRQAVHGRQHRRLHGRLVSPRDQEPRRRRAA